MSVKLNLLLQIASALAFLHQQKAPLAHGNLHPSNILLSPTLNPLLTDIGLVSVEKSLLRRKYDPSFIAPECRKQNNPTLSSDIYSLGCLILYVGRIDEQSDLQVLTNGEYFITDGFDFTRIEDLTFRYIIKRCCDPEPNVVSWTVLDLQNRPDISAVISDIVDYKDKYEIQNPTTSLPSSHVIYSQSTGCYLF